MVELRAPNRIAEAVFWLAASYFPAKTSDRAVKKQSKQTTAALFIP